MRPYEKRVVKAIGSSAKTFLNDERKPKMNFLHYWAVVLPQIFRKIALIGVKPLNSTNAVQIWLRQGTLKGKRLHFRLTCVAQKRLLCPGGPPYERCGDARRLA